MCTHVASHWRDTHTHTLLCTPAVSTHLHSTGTQTIAARGRVCGALPVSSAHALSSQPRLCHGDRLPTVLHGSPWTPCAAPPCTQKRPHPADARSGTNAAATWRRSERRLREYVVYSPWLLTAHGCVVAVLPLPTSLKTVACFIRNAS